MKEAVSDCETKSEENSKVCNPEVKIEDVLEDAGGFGWFQRIFSFMAIYPQIAAGMIILSPVFTGNDKVPLYCNNSTLPFSNSCIVSCIESGNDHDYASIVQEWDLVCSRSWIVGAVTSCQMVGMMTGSMVSSLLSDSFGRKKGYLFVTLCMGLFGMLPSIAIDPWTYAASRFLAGFGAGGVYVVYLVHLMEFLTPSWRTICGAVSLWPLGEMILGLAGYFIPNWRYLTALTAVPVFAVLLFYPLLQESPRWLLTQRRTKDAYDVLGKIANWNSRTKPQVATIEALQATILQQETKTMKTSDVLKQLVRNKKLILRLGILALANISCTVMYYGVSFSARSLSGLPSLNLFYMGILDFIRVPAVLVLSNWLGRKKTMITYLLFADACLIVILITHFSGNALMYPSLLTVFALLGRFGALSAWSTLICMTLESFPTTLRSSCLGFVSFAGYLGGIVAPQSLVLGSVSPSLPYILYCTLMTISSVFSLLLQEMAGEPLKDTFT